MNDSQMWGPGKVWKTKAAFLGWIRGGVRRALWNRSPVKISFMKNNRKRINKTVKGKPSTVWGGDCSICKKTFSSISLEVDHKKGGHSLREVSDIQKFIEGIVFVEEKDLQFVCKPCHKTKSYAEKSGISFERAWIQKRAIEIQKGDDKLWIEEQGRVPATNAKLRREQIILILEETING